jgi:integration host factor subunit beta
MTKADLIAEVTRVIETPRRDSEVIIDAIFDGIVRALRGAEKVEIRGFGSFHTRQRQPRVGRNPKTGALVDVPAKKIHYFKPGGELKNLVSAGGKLAESAPVALLAPMVKTDLRSQPREVVDCAVELTWKTATGEKRFEQCRAIDLSETGVAVECPETIPLLAHVIVRAPAFSVAALAQVRHCTWRRSVNVLGLHFVARTSAGALDPMAPDHYEILRLNSGADSETIERVYGTLTRRFHPDNDKTGDAEIFLRVAEAHRILSDPKRRQQYNHERDDSRSVVRFDLRSREFFAGLRGEQNRRLAVLCLLYRKRSSDLDSPGLSILDLEGLSGFTREELGFALWYLCEKGHARIDDQTKYGITTTGVDFVESRLTEDHSELRIIAAVQLPGRTKAPKLIAPVQVENQ